MNTRQLAAWCLGIAALCALTVAVILWMAASSAGLFAAGIAMGLAAIALFVAIVLGLTSFLAVRGGIFGQALAMGVSALLLLRLGPYFIGTILRGEALSWVAVVAVPTLLMFAVLVASGWGLYRSLRLKTAAS